MKILTYRDLESKNGLLPLMDHAFRWPFNPQSFEKFVKIDPRLKNSHVGFCAIEGDKVIGFVGVMDLATRTLDGNIEHVGGVYGVATLPGYTRRGISTILMNRAHEYFGDKGYRFSFLTTGHTLVAYAMYTKFGYSDVVTSASTYKVLEPKKAASYKKRENGRLDWDRILRIYNEFTKDKVGFVIRDKMYLRMLKKAERITAKQCIIDEDGYVIFRRDNGGIWIRELAASTVEEIEKLLMQIEEKAKAVVYDRVTTDARLLKIYSRRNYIIQKESHSIMMAKPLTANASFKQTYGNEFYMSSLDWF